MGGYDVFRSSVVKNDYLPALNLGTDLNSRRDDVAFIMTSPSKGYISTDKHQQGNFDIFKFEIKKQDNLSQTYIVVEEKSSIALPNTDVVVTNEFGEIVSKTKSDDKGKIRVDLEPLTQYTVTLNKDGYETKTTNLTSSDSNKNITLNQKKAIVTEDAIVIENIYFDFDKATIKQESTLSLNKIIEVLNNNPEMSIAINAHTDNKGSADYNQKLSERRAKSSYQYLINKGIAASRLTYKGYGESQLLNKCNKCNAEQDQANRRVEFKIIK
jgi:outer membrane protein OmpA-like peptidoglycan-associated protein